MRRSTGILALLALLTGLTACSGSSTKPATSPTPGPTATSTAALEDGLLAAADLGNGWRVGNAVNQEDRKAFAQLPCDSAKLDASVATRLTAVAGRQFEPTDRSYQHVMELVVTGSPGRLDADLRAIFAALASCPPTGPVTVRERSIPSVGEQRAAYTFTQAPPRSRSVLLVRVAYVRTGAVALMLGVTDFQAAAPGTSTFTDATVEKLLGKAVERLHL
jgi:hypothetical protein